MASNTPSRHTPIPPHVPPSLQQWDFPAGQLKWTPHPAYVTTYKNYLDSNEILLFSPHPQIPAANFWTPNTGLRGLPGTPQHFPTQPVGAMQAAQLTGGWPLPGGAPWWTQSVWSRNVHHVTSSPVQLAPCLIPNPADAECPQFIWDVVHDPCEAKGYTTQATLSLQAQFNKLATNPPTNVIRITVHDGLAQRIWGSIDIRKPMAVTVWDILSGIYEYFQTPTSQRELEYIHTLDQSNYGRLWEASRNRGAESPDDIRRVDSLGDTRRFWGLWITDQGERGWYLNLGLKGSPRSL